MVLALPESSIDGLFVTATEKPDLSASTRWPSSSWGPMVSDILMGGLETS